MKLSEGITAMEACLEMFGDVEFKFTESADGNPAVELKNVDTTAKPDADLGAAAYQWFEDEVLRFNIRFPVKNLYPFRLN